MKEAAEGHFTTEALQWNQDKSPTISGKVNKLLTNPYTFPRNSFCVSNLQFLQVFIDEKSLHTGQDRVKISKRV